MSNLLSCFWQSKKKGEYGGRPMKINARRGRRLSKENNEVIFVETGGYTDTGAENQPKFNSVRNVYRTETNSQSPQFERLCTPELNRQSKSYPVSPERRSVCKVYSFEQRPSFESQKLLGRRDSKDSRGLMVYAANINTATPRFSRNVENSNDNIAFGTQVNLPRRSTLTHGVDYEKEVLASKVAPAEEIFNKGASKVNPDVQLLRKENNENFSPRSSKMENKNLMILSTDSIITTSKIKTVVRARPQSSKNFALGNSVKPMVYRADDVVRKSNKEPPILATADGKILRPLTSGSTRRMSSISNRGSQQLKLSVVQPANAIEEFPLAQSGPNVIVAAPMIGGGGGGGMRRNARPQNTKSILRKGPSGGQGGQRGGPPQRRAPQVDDYDDYPYENDYGRGGQPYYDNASDMYLMDDNYSYGTGYYDDGYGYPDDGYGRGPVTPRGGRQAHHQVYAAQMPDITLPVASVDKGKNPPFKKTGKPLHTADVCIDKQFYDQKSEKDENEQQITKEHKVKLISSAQQTDLGNELDFICFSPDRCYKTSDIPDDPNSKLRWRIIIKRGDEE